MLRQVMLFPFLDFSQLVYVSLTQTGARNALWPSSPLSHFQLSPAEAEMEPQGWGRGCWGGGPGGLGRVVRPWGGPCGPDSTKEDEEGLLTVFQPTLPMNVYHKVLISFFLEMLGVVRCSMTICCVIKRENWALKFLVHYKGGHFPRVTSQFRPLDRRPDQRSSKINNNVKKSFTSLLFLASRSLPFFFIKVFHFLQNKAC